MPSIGAPQVAAVIGKKTGRHLYILVIVAWAGNGSSGYSRHDEGNTGFWAIQPVTEGLRWVTTPSPSRGDR